MSTFTDYENCDGMGLAELVRKRQVSPSELVEAAIERIEARNPRVNAVVHKMFDQARAAAQGELPDGPFNGVPFLLKDLSSVLAGVPLSSGSRFTKDYIPPYDSELVRRYKASGVVILGKTNTPELGLTPFTEPELFGPTRNPWNTERTPGGSSGGAAAAIASGMVPLAGGGDGGGSIRIPASCCGLFGIKPTRGRTPTGPDIGEAWEGFAQEHVLSRSVRDSAAMLDFIGGPDVGAPYVTPAPSRPFLDEVTTKPGPLRIAYTTEPFMGHRVHDDCVQGVEGTVKLLGDLGHRVVEAGPQVDGEALALAFLTMIMGQVRADIEKLAEMSGKKPNRSEFESATWTLGLLGKVVPASEYVKAVRFMQLVARRVGEFFEQYDVLLTPTLAEPPIVIGKLQPSAAERRLMGVVGALNAGRVLSALGVIKPMAAQTFDFIPYTPLFNITGQPAMSVPLHWNGEELPIGMHFVGRFADETTLFRLAGQLERAKPWFDKRPPPV